MSKFTKKAIIESFVQLLNQMPLDKITVKDVVNNCGVNRNTFYYYFHDLFDLLETLFMEETKIVVQDGKIYDSWKEGFLESIKFAMENKKAVYHIYNSLRREQLETYLYNVTGNLMLGYVDRQADGIEVSEEDKKFIAQFYKYALVGVVLDWIERGMRDDPMPFIAKMERLLDGNIKNILENNAQMP